MDDWEGREEEEESEDEDAFENEDEEYRRGALSFTYIVEVH